MPSPQEAACPTTTSVVLVHGANAVCEVPRAELKADPLTVTVLVLSGLLALAFAVMLRARRLSAFRGAALLVGALLLAGPGLYQVLLARPDAPPHAFANAARVTSLEQQLEAFAAARHGCVEVLRNDCEACEPIVRFVFPTHIACGAPEGRLDLRTDALDTGCTMSADTLQCGSAGAL